MEERVSSLETTIRNPNSVLNVNCLLVSDVHYTGYIRVPAFPYRVNTRIIFKSVLLDEDVLLYCTQYIERLSRN